MPASMPDTPLADPTDVPAAWTGADAAMLDLLRHLAADGYRFVAATPATHARVVARSGRQVARCVEDVLGWSLPFACDLLPPAVYAALSAGDMLVPTADGLERCLVRVSTLHGRPYLHSAYPTVSADAVFFGPDSYRFADLIAAELAHGPLQAGQAVVDICTGAGVGAIVAAGLSPGAHVAGIDINAKALRLARINAAAAGLEIELLEASGLDAVSDPVDLALINPPYIIDDAGRAYRDGGGMHGGQLSLDLSIAAMERLAPCGRLILYTGSAIVGGRDPLCASLNEAAHAAGCVMRYREIDPDVFGEELETEAYRDVDRIALVAAVVTRPD